MKKILKRFILKNTFLHRVFPKKNIIRLNRPKIKIDLELYKRPHYAYIVDQACKQAKLLGLKKISCIEFGVAGGSGLVEMEKLATEIGDFYNIDVEIYGFDIGEGMPAPLDYRDCPHIWQHGFYKMDIDLLSGRLRKSTLVIGDVKTTIKNFSSKYTPAPIAAISFDLDYYSSTKIAFNIFNLDDKYILPRVFCYFDDIIGQGGMMSDYTGELLAIKEFNDENSMIKITIDRSLLRKEGAPYLKWKNQIYVAHKFEHENYIKFLGEENDQRMLGDR